MQGNMILKVVTITDTLRLRIEPYDDAIQIDKESATQTVLGKKTIKH